MENWEEDRHVRTAFDWFIGFLQPDEWKRRKADSESYLQSLVKIHSDQNIRLSGDKIQNAKDQFAWYLTLAESYLTKPEDFDHAQGSRIIPIFKRIGIDIDLIRQIDGVEGRVRRIASSEKENPDSGIFEILVGAAYARNGWSDIAFIPETSLHKTPDLFVKKKGIKNIFVECKRLSMVSKYHRNEHKKWLDMWQYFSPFFQEAGLPFLLDINFHVELQSLDDEFLYRELVPKLRFVVTSGMVIDNNIWRVSVRMIDLTEVSEKFRYNKLKANSSSLNFLLTGENIQHNKKFTGVIDGHLDGKYFDSIRFAAGAIWSCDAESAIKKKARDIRKLLSKAITQIPVKEHGYVHIGLETLEGFLVEKERMQRIMNTVFNFDTFGKNVDFIFCHLFGASVPPDQNWLFDETVYKFLKDENIEMPLNPPFLVANDEETFRKGVHWE